MIKNSTPFLTHPKDFLGFCETAAKCEEKQ